MSEAGLAGWSISRAELGRALPGRNRNLSPVLALRHAAVADPAATAFRFWHEEADGNGGLAPRDDNARYRAESLEAVEVLASSDPPLKARPLNAVAGAVAEAQRVEQRVEHVSSESCLGRARSVHHLEVQETELFSCRLYSLGLGGPTPASGGDGAFEEAKLHKACCNWLRTAAGLGTGALIWSSPLFLSATSGCNPRSDAEVLCNDVVEVLWLCQVSCKHRSALGGPTPTGGASK